MDFIIIGIIIVLLAVGLRATKKREAVVSMEREISDEEIRAAVKKAGYRVIEIKCRNKVMERE